MTAPDVVVVGAGIVGAATAWELTRRGARVTLVDRAGVSEGTTGLGEGNVLCGDKDAGPELELAVLGRAMYDEVESLVGEAAAIRRKGSLIVHPEASTWAAEPNRVDRLRALGVDCDLLSSEEVHYLEPPLAGPVCGAVHVPGDLQCDPQGVTWGLAERAREGGAVVRLGASVNCVVVRGGRVAGVIVDGTELGAGAVVVAAGPWSKPLAAGAGLYLPVEPRKGQLVQLGLPSPDPRWLRSKIVDGSYLGSVASTDASLELSTVVETTANGEVLVGATRERCGFDETVSDALSASLRDRAARLVPALARLPIRTAWVGFRPWLPDHLPAIGPSEQVRGLWVGTGHEGSGVGLGPITGRLLAQAICGEDVEVDLTPFNPDRFA